MSIQELRQIVITDLQEIPDEYLAPIHHYIRHFQLKHQFQSLAAEWKEAVHFYSILHKATQHPNYQAIINMGKDALPFIFEALKEQPDWWFPALQAITKVNPVPPEHKGHLVKMTNDWLLWAKQNQLIHDAPTLS